MAFTGLSRTSQSGASAQISFQGNAIAVYGATSGNHALYTAEMDGGLAVTLNGSASHFYPQNTLVSDYPFIITLNVLHQANR